MNKFSCQAAIKTAFLAIVLTLGLVAAAEAKTQSYSVIVPLSQSNAAAAPGPGGTLPSCSCSNAGTTYACGQPFTGTVSSSEACPTGYYGSGTASVTGPFICDAAGVIEPNGLVHTSNSFAGCVKPQNVTYGTCAAACGSSSEALNTSWTCVTATGLTVPQSQCISAGAVPAPAQSCNDYSACVDNPAYACSTTCGAGTNNLQSYTCGPASNPSQYTQAQCVSFGVAAPAATNGSCTAVSGCTYSYTPSSVSYGTCAANCGASTAPLNLTWTCTRSDGAIVDQSYCRTAGSVPPATKSCNDYSTCTVDPVYGSCDTTCGTGKQELQSWTCGPANNPTQYTSAQCTSFGVTAPPASSGTCTATSGCNYTYNPNSVTYGSCAANCGASTAPVNTNWTCQRSDGVQVDQSFCVNSGHTPPATQSCNNYSACTVDPVYGSCNASCGSGQQVLQSWTCGPANNPTEYTSAQCTSFGVATPPATSGTCTSTSGCNYTYAPTAVTYGACQAACGTSTAPLATTWVCKRSDGVIVDQGLCITAGQVPPATESCVDYSACTVTPIYGGCNTQCGTGQQALQSWTCGPASNPTEYPSAECTTFGVAAPASTNGVACTDNTGCNYTYAYSGANYGSCQPACGQSIQALVSYTCTRSDGLVVDPSICANAGIVPAATEPCTDFHACVTAPLYGACSNTCGDGSQVLESWTCGPAGNTAKYSAPQCQSVGIQAPASTNGVACHDESTCTTVCGPDNGGTFTTEPWVANPTGLCQTGSVISAAGSGTPSETATTYSYTCSSQVCSANRQSPGVCGPLNGGTDATAPWTDGNYGNLCAAGSVPVNGANNNQLWTWACNGPNGGASVGCYAGQVIAGACGSDANGQTFASGPWAVDPADLCGLNQVSANGSFDTATHAWRWSCAGNNGGTTTWCEAPEQYATRYFPQSFGACSATCGDGKYTLNYGCLLSYPDGFQTWADPAYCAGETASPDLWHSLGGVEPACHNESGCQTVCGPDNGGAFRDAPWSPAFAGGLCQTGSVASAANSANGQVNGFSFAWTCGSQSCAAAYVIDGVVGPANGVPTGVFPAALCNAGIPANGSFDGTNFHWSCNGVNGGNNVNGAAPGVHLVQINPTYGAEYNPNSNCTQQGNSCPGGADYYCQARFECHRNDNDTVVDGSLCGGLPSGPYVFVDSICPSGGTDNSGGGGEGGGGDGGGSQ